MNSVRVDSVWCRIWSPWVKGAVTESVERREKKRGREGREGGEEWTDTGNGGGGVWLGEDGE